MTDKIVTKELDRALQAALAELGFKKSSPGTCCIPLAEEAQGWVGFNSARTGDGAVEVAPMVGVHYAAIHRLIAQLRGEKYKGCDPPTFSQNAGYLMPERRKFIAVRFENPEQIPERIPVYVELVRDIGLPYMRQNTSLDAVLETLRQVKSLQSFEERLAAGEYLRGKREVARQIVDDHLRELQSKHAVLRQDFEKFSTPFLELLSK